MRKSACLSPRGKRTRWRVNCYDTGTIITSADFINEKNCQDIGALWEAIGDTEVFRSTIDERHKHEQQAVS